MVIFEQIQDQEPEMCVKCAIFYRSCVFFFLGFQSITTKNFHTSKVKFFEKEIKYFFLLLETEIDKIVRSLFKIYHITVQIIQLYHNILVNLVV